PFPGLCASLPVAVWRRRRFQCPGTLCFHRTQENHRESLLLSLLSSTHLHTLCDLQKVEVVRRTIKTWKPEGVEVSTVVERDPNKVKQLKYSYRLVSQLHTPRSCQSSIAAFSNFFLMLFFLCVGVFAFCCGVLL